MGQKEDLLRASTIRVIAKKTSFITEFEIKGILKTQEIIQSDKDYYKILLEYGDRTSGSKEAKVEAVLNCLSKRQDEKLFGVITELIKANLRYISPEGIEKMNSFLRRDGFEYDVEKKRVMPSIGQVEEEQKIVSELDRLLSELNPDFVKMHQGAWEALVSGSSDSFRQSIASMRELLSQVLRLKAPQGKTRKEKVRIVLSSESDADLIESMANLADKLYSIQSKEEHTKPEYDRTVLALKISEYVLYYMLSSGR